MTRSGATPSLQTRPAVAAVVVGIGLSVGVDDLAQEPDRLGHRRVGHRGQLGHDHPSRSDQLTQMSPAGLGILPVDLRFGPAKRLRCSTGRPAQPVPGRSDRLAQKPADQLIAIGHRPGPIHRGTVDNGGQATLEDPRLAPP